MQRKSDTPGLDSRAPSALQRKLWDMWELTTHNGRQVWCLNREQYRDIDPEVLDAAFAFDTTVNANSADRVYRYLATRGSAKSDEWDKTGTGLEEPANAASALAKGIAFYNQLQLQDGHWPGDYGGPLFLLPGLVVAAYVTNAKLARPETLLMKRYMLNHQNSDGGWGLHIEGSSTMFGTVMQYVALRILGADPDGDAIARARQWILAHGGATGIPPWGKFYLALLGAYSWEGCDSLLPEMWLLPKWLPFHPSRYWCHARMVYLPMSYCFGHRITGQQTRLVEQLRRELYKEPYEQINWKRSRSIICESDLYSRPSKVLALLNKWIINPYERVHIRSVRKRALAFSMAYVDAEDAQTRYVDIGPVNQVLNSICAWHAHGPDSEQFLKHTERWKDYLWLAEDGMKMNGYNGSQLWDTAFAAQAMLEGGKDVVDPGIIRRAYGYLDSSQVLEDVDERKRFFRHRSRGGWPFSTFDHGWPISDCTAEGLSAALAIHRSGMLANSEMTISTQRMRDAVDLVLSFQNRDGGWATYENTRGPKWLEILNPSGVFGDIMIDYSYTECTSACVRALCEFAKTYPVYRKDAIRRAIDRGVRFISSRQEENGSWIGSWGVCFTYGTWFGIEGLIAGGVPTSHGRVRRAVSFLLSRQNADGGWGESFKSCVEREYIPHTSNAVNTSWALLALMASGQADHEAVERGIRFLIGDQEANGDWPQAAISGVFNANCMITYTSYRNVFPIWALGRYRKLAFGNQNATST